MSEKNVERVAIIIVTSFILLSALYRVYQTVSPCNDQVLSDVRGINIGNSHTLSEMSEALIKAGTIREYSTSWEIYPRVSGGCEVTLSGYRDNNIFTGVKISWYVDLNERTVKAGNNTASGLVLGFVEGSGDLTILKEGYPLP
jgi:hypothetical protein